jgi:hypothetical protein
MRDDKQMDAYINALVQRCSVALALESERSRTQ